ncbi:MAG: septation ring formation regulator EzrA [Erysipelotrichaceae bacterium]|nr:septation ring formation regulator EzrA [Erysipelotrichaceae bacterium]
MDWEQILAFMTQIEVMIALAGIFILTIISLIIRKTKIKNCQKALNEFEIRYNSIKSIPLSFKLNKAVALARVDASLQSQVNTYKDTFDSVHVSLKQITEMLAEMEDNIVSGNLKAAKLNVIDLDGMLDRNTNEVNKLDRDLDNILLQETQQRDEINKYKEDFREIKNVINQNVNAFAFSNDAINGMLVKIENQFTDFEELMYASDFNKAKAIVDEIAISLVNMRQIIDELPTLLVSARGTIPKLIDNVSENYSICKQKGIFLNHLDVLKNIEVITETLKQDISQLRQAELEHITENLSNYQTRLEQLLIQIDRENKAYDELVALKNESFLMLANTKEMLEQIEQIYLKVSQRYGYDNIEENLNEAKLKIEDLDQMSERLAKLCDEHTIPASTILISLKEFEQEINTVYISLKELKSGLDLIRTDEERAKKQLLKLHLIMNEIQTKIKKHRLPAISERYDGDVSKANEYILTLQNLLEEIPLNPTLLTTTLAEAIDFIYMLFNNVNNLVGMALMVENTIVFGNKYRSTYADLDSELTRAELNYRNGDYTQALTIAMNAVEKLNLESYEQRIKENASSAS